MKYYDKNLSKINSNIKNILLVLVVFFIGFFVGYIVGGGETTMHSNQTNTSVVNKV